MTTVYFVRHAQPNFANHDDRLRELSPKGEADAVLAAQYFADKQIDIVLSSPYKRAVDTVKGIAQMHGLEIVCKEDFRERRVDDGWIEDFDAFSRSQWADFDYKLPGGESLKEVQRRNVSALGDVLRQYSGKNIVVGSHGTALSTIINFYLPTFGYEEFQAIRGLMPWIVRFDFEGGQCRQISSIDALAVCVSELILYRQ